MGAGVIPLAVKDGEVLFLFQKTFTGRKAGQLIDFSNSRCKTHPVSATGRGRLKPNTAPFPGALATHSFPP